MNKFAVNPFLQHMGERITGIRQGAGGVLFGLQLMTW